ncbi:uncharacterized protein LOC100184591 isoform X1 [Ciona intestinalis]
MYKQSYRNGHTSGLTCDTTIPESVFNQCMFMQQRARSLTTTYSERVDFLPDPTLPRTADDWSENDGDTPRKFVLTKRGEQDDVGGCGRSIGDEMSTLTILTEDSDKTERVPSATSSNENQDPGDNDDRTNNDIRHLIREIRIESLSANKGSATNNGRRLYKRREDNGKVTRSVHGDKGSDSETCCSKHGHRLSGQESFQVLATSKVFGFPSRSEGKEIWHRRRSATPDLQSSSFTNKSESDRDAKSTSEFIYDLSCFKNRPRDAQTSSVKGSALGRQQPVITSPRDESEECYEKAVRIETIQTPPQRKQSCEDRSAESEFKCTGANLKEDVDLFALVCDKEDKDVKTQELLLTIRPISNRSRGGQERPFSGRSLTGKFVLLADLDDSSEETVETHNSLEEKKQVDSAAFNEAQHHRKMTTITREHESQTKQGADSHVHRQKAQSQNCLSDSSKSPTEGSLEFLGKFRRSSLSQQVPLREISTKTYEGTSSEVSTTDIDDKRIIQQAVYPQESATSLNPMDDCIGMERHTTYSFGDGEDLIGFPSPPPSALKKRGSVGSAGKKQRVKFDLDLEIHVVPRESTRTTPTERSYELQGADSTGSSQGYLVTSADNPTDGFDDDLENLGLELTNPFGRMSVRSSVTPFRVITSRSDTASTADDKPKTLKTAGARTGRRDSFDILQMQQFLKQQSRERANPGTASSHGTQQTSVQTLRSKEGGSTNSFPARPVKTHLRNPCQYNQERFMPRYSHVQLQRQYEDWRERKQRRHRAVARQNALDRTHADCGHKTSTVDGTDTDSSVLPKPKSQLISSPNQQRIMSAETSPFYRRFTTESEPALLRNTKAAQFPNPHNGLPFSHELTGGEGFRGGAVRPKTSEFSNTRRHLWRTQQPRSRETLLEASPNVAERRKAQNRGVVNVDKLNGRFNFARLSAGARSALKDAHRAYVNSVNEAKTNKAFSDYGNEVTSSVNRVSGKVYQEHDLHNGRIHLDSRSSLPTTLPSHATVRRGDNNVEGAWRRQRTTKQQGLTGQRDSKSIMPNLIQSQTNESFPRHSAVTVNSLGLTAYTPMNSNAPGKAKENTTAKMPRIERSVAERERRTGIHRESRNSVNSPAAGPRLLISFNNLAPSKYKKRNISGEGNAGLIVTPRLFA